MLKFHRASFAFTVWVVVLSGPRPVAAQALTVATFPNAYREAEEKLYRKYVVNRRTKHRTAVNHSTESNSRLGLYSEFMDVSGENASRTNYLNEPTPGGPLKITGHLQLRDVSYTLQSGDRPGTHKLNARRPRTSTNRPDSAAAASGPCMYPITYLGSLADTTMGQVITYIEEGLPTGPQFKLLGVRSTDWHDKPVYEVKFASGRFGVIDLLYLDPANDLAFLGSESDGTYDFKTMTIGPIKFASRLTYRPSDEGYPLPWKFETWHILPDGRRVPQSSAVVTEYAKYTPTADDFDLEKQFGVTPELPPEPPVPEALSRRGLYAVAAVATLLAGWGVAVVRRRRRLAAKAISVEG